MKVQKLLLCVLHQCKHWCYLQHLVDPGDPSLSPFYQSCSSLEVKQFLQIWVHCMNRDTQEHLLSAPWDIDMFAILNLLESIKEHASTKSRKTTNAPQLQQNICFCKHFIRDLFRYWWKQGCSTTILGIFQHEVNNIIFKLWGARSQTSSSWSFPNLL